MPIRDYRCDCGYEVRDHLEGQDAEPLVCDSCGGLMARLFPSRVGVVVRASSGSTIERADWNDYSHADMADPSIAAEAAYEVARKSGIDEGRARGASRVAGEAMQSAGATLIENQEAHAAELAAAGGET